MDSLLKHHTMICFSVNMGAATCSTFFAFQRQKDNWNRMKRKVKTASPGIIVPCHYNWSQSSSHQPCLNHPASLKATYKRMRSVYIWSRLYSSKIICLIHIQHKRQKKKKAPAFFENTTQRTKVCKDYCLASNEVFNTIKYPCLMLSPMSARTEASGGVIVVDTYSIISLLIQNFQNCRNCIRV